MTTSDPEFAPLFTPFAVNGLELPNRIVMPGMQRHWVEDGRPLPRLGEYYRRRAEAGVGLIITESGAIDHPTSTQSPLFARVTDATLDAWRACVERVKSAGGNMLMQLWHEGAWQLGAPPNAAYEAISPSGLIRAGKQNGRAATAGELVELREAFVRSALVAKQAGADGVEVHGAHGFLIDQFLWADTNRRTDGYGGDDPADRVRFPAEVVAAIRDAVGPNFVISFRMSQWKEDEYEARIVDSPEELDVVLAALRRAGVDVFHVSARRFWLPEWPGSDLGIAGWVRSLTDAPVIAVGSVGLDTDVMESFSGKTAAPTGAGGFGELMRRFNDHQFDLVAVGRSHIADADFVPKLRAGRIGEIKTFTRADLLGNDEPGAPVEAHA